MRVGLQSRSVRWCSAFVAGLSLAFGPPTALAQDTPRDNDAPPGGKRITLSFDDAPRSGGEMFSGPERTIEFIAALAEAKSPPVLMYVTTRGVKQRPFGAARIRAYAAAGHYLANHSHTHPWLWKTEADAYLADIDEASGILADFDNVLPLFRFPFLDEGRTEEKRDTVRAGLKERGLANGYVTIDNYDWYMEALFQEALKAGHDVDLDTLRDVYVRVILESVQFYDNIAIKTLGRSPTHVLLLHENDLAALFIGDAIEALRADGWTIVSAETAYDDPIADEEPDTLFLGQGRVAALARLQGWKGRDLVNRWEDEDALHALFLSEGLLPADTPDD